MAQMAIQNGSEVEDNNSTANANIITSGQLARGTVQPITDATDPLDVFTISVAKAGTLSLALGSDNNANIQVDVTDSSGTSLLSAFRVGVDLAQTISLTAGTDVFISLRSPSGTAEYDLRATFAENEPEPPVLSISDASGEEADTFNTSITFTASLSFAATSDVTFIYDPTAQTATATTDFTPGLAQITIPAGSTSTTFSVPIVGDTTIEPNELVSVAVTDVSNATLSNGQSNLTLTGTILDNDGFTWSAQAYLSANIDLLQAGVSVDDALGHYVSNGYQEGRRLSFDTEAYLQVNPDLGPGGITTENALEHFTLFGQFEGRPLDADDYLNANPDLVNAGLDADGAGVHFVNFGRNEGRTLSFDAPGYLLLNPDLVTAGLTVPQLIEHFNIIGQAEGRKIFDPGAYIAANSDVADAGVDVYLHYQEIGQAEGRALEPVSAAASATNGSLGGFDLF